MRAVHDAAVWHDCHISNIIFAIEQTELGEARFVTREEVIEVLGNIHQNLAQAWTVAVHKISKRVDLKRTGA